MEFALDWLLIIAVIFLGYFVILLIRFAQFKSRLMSAFGTRGIPYEIADELYSLNQNLITALHRDGHSANKIVDAILEGLDN